MTEETNKNGYSTQYEYTEHNRLAKVIRLDSTELQIADAQSATISNGYVSGATGDMKSIENGEVIDGIKNPRGIDTFIASDFQGFVTHITDGEGRVTSNNSFGKTIS